MNRDLNHENEIYPRGDKKEFRFIIFIQLWVLLSETNILQAEGGTEAESDDDEAPERVRAQLHPLPGLLSHDAHLHPPLARWGHLCLGSRLFLDPRCGRGADERDLSPTVCGTALIPHPGQSLTVLHRQVPSGSPHPSNA